MNVPGQEFTRYLPRTLLSVDTSVELSLSTRKMGLKLCTLKVALKVKQ